MDVALPDSHVARIMPVHLDTRDSATRHGSVKALLRAQQASPYPVVMLGDFNSTLATLPDARPNASGQTALDVLIAHGLATRQPTIPLTTDAMTFPADHPKRVIDWIIVDDEMHITDYRVIGSTLSDHRPVVANLSLSE